MKFFQKFLFCFGFSIGLLHAQQFNALDQLKKPSGENFSFVIIGDRTKAGPSSWEILEKAIPKINALHPDFIIHIGDVIEGGNTFSELETQWKEALTHLSKLQTVVFLTPGNHDIPNARGCTVWQNHFGKVPYGFSFGNAHFIVLNTEAGACGGQRIENFGQSQIDFLKEYLKSYRKGQKLFLFMHKPAWLMKGTLQSEWLKIESLLSRTSFIVFAGHAHVLAGEKRGNAKYFVVGPTGGALRTEPNPALGSLHHFTLVQVQGDSVKITFHAEGIIYPESLAYETYNGLLENFLLLKNQEYLKKLFKTTP